MSQKTKEWKKNQIEYPVLDDDVYSILDTILANYKGSPPHRLYNDIRLVLREIIANERLHSKTALIIGIKVGINQSHVFNATIYHDGAVFDPFLPTNDCKLLLQLNAEYGFTPGFSGTDSGRHTMKFTFNLSTEYTGV